MDFYAFSINWEFYRKNSMLAVTFGVMGKFDKIAIKRWIFCVLQQPRPFWLKFFLFFTVFYIWCCRSQLANWRKIALNVLRRIDNIEIQKCIFLGIFRKIFVLQKLLEKKVEIDRKIRKKKLAAFCSKLIALKNICF